VKTSATDARRKAQGAPNWPQIGFLLLFFAATVWVLNYFHVFSPRDPEPHDVTYRVEGSAATVTISYTLADGQQSERFETTLPWTRRITFTETTTAVLTATNPTQTGGMTCILLLDGQPWKRDSTAHDDKVACAGVVP
jgi:hypothetical protein